MPYVIMSTETRKIMESLTIARVKSLKVAQAKYGKTNVWTSDGPIFFKINSNKFSLFRS